MPDHSSSPSASTTQILKYCDADYTDLGDDCINPNSEAKFRELVDAQMEESFLEEQARISAENEAFTKKLARLTAGRSSANTAASQRRHADDSGLDHRDAEYNQLLSLQHLDSRKLADTLIGPLYTPARPAPILMTSHQIAQPNIDLESSSLFAVAALTAGTVLTVGCLLIKSWTRGRLFRSTPADTVSKENTPLIETRLNLHG